MSTQFSSIDTKGFSGRIPELDGIRGIAILLVLIWHYGVRQIKVESHPLISYAINALGLTWSGVDLFFVLSGFLIGGVLLDNKYASNYFKVFYIRRICRIFPLYFLWLSIFVWIVYQAPDLAKEYPFRWLFGDPMPLLSYATYTQNIVMAQKGFFGSNWLGITWSLALEEQFYLIAPFIIYFIPLKKLPYVLAFLILTAPLCRLGFYYFHPHMGFTSHILMPCRIDALLLGVLCAYTTRHEGFMSYITSHLTLLYGAFFILLIGAASLALRSQSIGSWAMSAYGYSVLALLYSCFLLIAVTEQHGPISAIARNSLLQSMGLIAYGIYMFHQGFSGLVHGILLKQSPQIRGGLDLMVTLGALFLTLIAAYVSWTFFEKPIVKVGHFLKYQKVP
ncbi:MAG: acyltransferase family protein [Roseiflexaceae bacterium]